MKKVHTYERGAAHILAIVAFVFLLGAVGFVGYNAWQKQSTNAGGRPIVGTPVTYDATKPATYRYGANDLCRMYHTLHAKIAVVKDQTKVIQVMSGNSKLLSVDTAKQKPGTRYFASSRFAGSFENATVKYVVKTPATRTITQKAKNGKTKKVSETTWSEAATAVLVRELPRCVPTTDPNEYNFYGGGQDGVTNACTNNGEVVFRWMSFVKAPASTQPKLIAALDGKTVKTINVADNKVKKYYYSQVSASGSQFKLSFTDNKNYKGSKARVLVNKAISTIKSCL